MLRKIITVVIIYRALGWEKALLSTRYVLTQVISYNIPMFQMGKLGHRRGKVTCLSLRSCSGALRQAREGGADGEKTALQQG